MAKHTFNYATSSAEQVARNIIAWARQGDVGATATVERGLDHTRTVMDACNAGSLDKEQITRICNAFKQACNRLNLPFTVGTKKDSLIVTPRTVVEKADSGKADSGKAAAKETAKADSGKATAKETNKADLIELQRMQTENTALASENAALKKELDKARKLITKLQTQLETLKAVSVPALAQAA